MQSNAAVNGTDQNGTVPPAKHSMLDKLKLFNKEKSDRSSKTQISKRTSSSSGFSSARSERSDSSLSLNEGQASGKQNNLKKPEVITSKTKSKLLASTTKSGSKDTLSTKKVDKKDNSPARSENSQMCESKVVPPKVQKVTNKAESKLKLTGSLKKLEARSESKTSLSQIPAPKSGNSTGIPKPMAAIKGTTKPPVYQTQYHKSEQNDVTGAKLNDISNQNISNSEDGKMQIVAPLMIEIAANNQFVRHMDHQQMVDSNISLRANCKHSKPTHNSSMDLRSNSSESSIIYRPTSESGSDISQMHHSAMSPQHKVMMPHRKIDRNQTVPPVTASSNNVNKFNTVPTKVVNAANGIIYEEERQMTIVPMRPLLRGYNSHLTLPTRGARGQHMISEYTDDIGQGYCSDGDALRKIQVRYSDIENGYMSEGGGMSNAKHLTGLLRARTQLPTTIEER